VFNGTISGGGEGLFDVVVDSDGWSSDPNIVLTGEVGPCDVVYNPINNQFLWVWQEKVSGEWDIYGRQISAVNGAYGPLIAVSTANRGQQRPRVAYNPDDNQYLVVWDDFRNESDFDVYAQKVNVTASLDGDNFAVASSATAASQGYPAVAYVENIDRYRVVFQDNRDTGTLGWDLRGQWLGDDGANLGTLDAPLVRYPGNQLEPDIAASQGLSYDLALTVWEDTRSGGSDIYGSFSALDDNPPVARFTRGPGVFRRVGTTFIFNAWPSRDDVTPRSLLEVRWDVDGDGAWDDEQFSYTKYVTHTFASTGWHTITLEVRDEALLTDTLSLRVFTLPAADPPMDGAASADAVAAASGPTATLTISPAFKTSGETFTFDGTGSTGGALQARWDWENDGLFDTDFGATLTATHVYTVAGDYTVRLEVLGSGGLSDVALYNITVAPDDAVQLEVSPQVVTVIPGEVLRFRVTGWDQYDNVMYHPDVTWVLTDTQAGTIDASGVFTASVAVGTYADVIQVESDDVIETASVTIVWPYQVYLPVVLKDD
jgi:PKD repeat protein